MFGCVDLSLVVEQSRATPDPALARRGPPARPTTETRLLQPQRQQLILDRIRRDGAVRVSDLVSELDVSDMTIRRDLASLADRGLIRKVHGGATIAEPPSTDEPGFEVKSTRQLPEKRAIAEAVRRFVDPGDAIALSAGTTTYEVARRLASVPRLTVITNSIPAAEVFHASGREDQTVVLTGGVRTPSDALVGPTTVDALQSLHVNLTILGVHGMDERGGLTTPNLQEAETNRALIASGRTLLVVADHTKWGVMGLSSMASLSDVDVFVTDDGLGQDARRVLGEHVGELVVASTGDEEEGAG